MNTFEIPKPKDSKHYVVKVKQWIRPNGDLRIQFTDLPLDTEPLYKQMEKHKCHFQAEYLHTGEVAVYISRPDDNIHCLVVPNGPDVQKAMVQMLKDKPWLVS